jgi:hypothetical protein
VAVIRCRILPSSLLSKTKLILPVVLYACETLSLTLKKEHWPLVFENGVLQKIFQRKRDQVTGE